MEVPMVKRELYLKRIRPFYDSELIKIITGIRRCGKSTLLRQIKDELIEMGTKDTEILFMNFEDYQYHKYLMPEELYNYVEDVIKQKRCRYLMFDEIQNVKDFELVINSFRATHDISIFVTGSNSKLLSGELSTHLGGRTLSFRMLPFCFKEYAEFKATDPTKELLIEYMEWGGFPLVCSSNEEETKEVILSNLYDSVVLKDIIMRNKISSAHALNKIIDYLIANSSLTLSVSNIAKALKEDEIKLSVPTVYDYINYIIEAGIVDKLERYDIRGKKVLSFEEKIYTCDLGLLHLKKNRVKDEFNLKIETLVYNELIARGYQVYIGKTYKGEVDFIAEKSGKRIYIQVAYLLSSEKTIEREFGAFQDIQDNYPKFVVTFDDMKMKERDGIIHIPILSFLMNEDFSSM